MVSHLKKGTGRFSHIVLQPQPSDDMRDPLNWPTWKKEGLFWTLCYMSGLVGKPLETVGGQRLESKADPDSCECHQALPGP